VLINSRVVNPSIFGDVQIRLKTQFQALTRDAEEKIRGANMKHFLAARMALDTLRNENVVLEAERNPEFREMMREQVANAQRLLRDIAAAVSAADQRVDLA
jgi:hypothetical protein